MKNTVSAIPANTPRDNILTPQTPVAIILDYIKLYNPRKVKTPLCPLTRDNLNSSNMASHPLFPVFDCIFRRSAYFRERRDLFVSLSSD